MRIRFLQTCQSDTADFPFRAGQVLDVEVPSPSMRVALRVGLAEIVHEEPEATTVGARSERAVLPKAKGRRA